MDCNLSTGLNGIDLDLSCVLCRLDGRCPDERLDSCFDCSPTFPSSTCSSVLSPFPSKVASSSKSSASVYRSRCFPFPFAVKFTLRAAAALRTSVGISVSWASFRGTYPARVFPLRPRECNGISDINVDPRPVLLKSQRCKPNSRCSMSR